MVFDTFEDINDEDYTDVFESEDNLGATVNEILNEYIKQSDDELLSQFSVMLGHCFSKTHCEQDNGAVVYCKYGPRIDWIRNDKGKVRSIKDVAMMVANNELLALHELQYLEASIGSLKKPNKQSAFLVVKSKLKELITKQVQEKYVR